MAAALEAAERDRLIRAIVIIGEGRTFIAGADIRELERAAREHGAPPELHGLLAQIEDSSKPVVMAIHGAALGGGLEVAMAGHYRIATADAQLGQPEVNLGIIPGAEGTQRLPRLVGIAAAIEMCVSGKPVAAAEALRLGLIDRTIDGDFHRGAIAVAREKAIQPGPHPINEGARILEEGHVLRAADIDTIYLTGYGYPPYHGGPMWYADTVGLKRVYRRVEEFHALHGERWAPAPLLKHLAEEGSTFAAFDAAKESLVRS
jgi:enoyl-CoA hydratase/carnithine racemase